MSPMAPGRRHGTFPDVTTRTAPRRRTRVLALGGLALAAGAGYLLLAQPRVDRWGATDAEHHETWPGDELLPRPGFVWTNAVTIERPAEAVWPWVAQLGQGRGGLYSYDWLENAIGCGVHSAAGILPQHQRPLHVGDRVVRMCRYAPYNPVARFDPGRALVLGDVKDTAAERAAGRSRGTWAFIVEPVDGSTSRLIVRSRGDALATRIQGPIQFVMQRRTMLGIKERAEGGSASRAQVLEPLLWLAVAGLVAAASTAALVRRERWRQPLAVAGAAAAALLWLMFRQPPVGVGVRSRAHVR
jgi:hypothetical protein